MCICNEEKENLCEITGFETLSEANKDFVNSGENVVMAFVTVNSSLTLIILIATRKRLLLYHFIDMC